MTGSHILTIAPVALALDNIGCGFRLSNLHAVSSSAGSGAEKDCRPDSQVDISIERYFLFYTRSNTSAALWGTESENVKYKLHLEK